MDKGQQLILDHFEKSALVIHFVPEIVIDYIIVSDVILSLWSNKALFRNLRSYG